MADTEAQDADFVHDTNFADVEDSFAASEPMGANPKNKPNKFKKTMKRIFMGLMVIIIGLALAMVGQFLGSGEKIVEITPAPVKAENNNKLVYISASPIEGEFTDEMFNVSAKGLGLDRVVEMYQWAFENGEYIKKWSTEAIIIEGEDAAAKGYVNPPELPFPSQKWHAEKVSLGSFTVSPDLAQQIKKPMPLSLTEENFMKLDEEGKLAFKLAQNTYFFGINPDQPNIGDLRVSFINYPAQMVSIIAKQSGEMLEMFPGKSGPVGIVRPGKVTPEIIATGIDLGANPMLKWIMRAIAVLFAVIGAFVMVGQKRSKTPERDQNEEIISHNEMYVEEEAEPSIEENNEPSQYSSEQPAQMAYDAVTSYDTATNYEPNSYASPAPEPSYDSFDDAPSLQAPSYENIYGDLPPEPIFPPEPAVEAPKQFVAPQPLDFSVIEQPQDDSSVTSTLQQFGIINEQGQAFAPETNPETQYAQDTGSASSFASPTPIDFNAQAPASYAPHEYTEDQSEEMPFEVEVISEDSLPDFAHDNTSQALTQPPAPEVAQAPVPEFVPPVTENYASQVNEPMNFDDLSDEMPVNVEIISEEDIGNMEASAAPVSQNEADVVPENQAPIAPLDYDGESEHNVAAAVEPAAPILPPVPDYDAIFTPKTPEVELLPPPPDYEKLFNDAPVAPVEPAITRAQPSPSIPVASPAHEAVPHAPTESGGFDLPNIPADFDPHSEMTVSESPYAESNEEAPIDEDHFSQNDSHSPFGDAEDDPFAHHDEKKS